MGGVIERECGREVYSGLLGDSIRICGDLRKKNQWSFRVLVVAASNQRNNEE